MQLTGSSYGAEPAAGRTSPISRSALEDYLESAKLVVGKLALVVWSDEFGREIADHSLSLILILVTFVSAVLCGQH